jgi:hypothetical protein
VYERYSRGVDTSDGIKLAGALTLDNDLVSPTSADRSNFGSIARELAGDFGDRLNLGCNLSREFGEPGRLLLVGPYLSTLRPGTLLNRTHSGVPANILGFT